MSARASQHFDREASGLASRYDSLTFDEVHGAIAAFLPAASADILDIGAGNGRDARALAALGFQVTAVEPSASFRLIAATASPQSGVEWVDDRLPRLASLDGQAGAFAFILCSAVLMYLPPGDLGQSLATMSRLLAPPGHLAISIRDPAPGEPQGLIHRHDDAAVLRAAQQTGLRLAERSERGDALGRAGNLWRSFVFAHRTTAGQPA
jgi:2-polyprenyl-3-methyl-5-hydroxy-6-metoxy-1,4-benzoquinol methylase